MDKVKADDPQTWYYSSMKNSREKEAAITEIRPAEGSQGGLFEA